MIRAMVGKLGSNDRPVFTCGNEVFNTVATKDYVCPRNFLQVIFLFSLSPY